MIICLNGSAVNSSRLPDYAEFPTQLAINIPQERKDLGIIAPCSALT
jgi:hypothetical protein